MESFLSCARNDGEAGRGRKSKAASCAKPIGAKPAPLGQIKPREAVKSAARQERKEAGLPRLCRAPRVTESRRTYLPLRAHRNGPQKIDARL